MANQTENHHTSHIFQTYAEVYDDLYREKNYQSECDFLEQAFDRYGKEKIQTILDLGCGTGGHGIPLATRGHRVYGVDSSDKMIEVARQKAEEKGLSARLKFEVANIQQLQLQETFDAVICMFAVLGYQTSNEGIFATLQGVRKHLKPGGLFICDFWYGPAVLKQRPTDRVKVVPKDSDRIVRLTQSAINTQTHIVDVNYHLLHLQEKNLINEVEELHKMRFIFKPELEFFMKQAGLELMGFCSFAELEKTASEDTWNVSAIGQAI